MTSREKVIGFLQEMAEYFRECRSNASFASKAENHFWELQNAANEAAELLKEQEEEIENLKQTAQSMMEGICLLKEQDNCENCSIAVEDRQLVVRCKDCKYAHKTYDGACKYCDMLTDDDGYLIERYLPGDWFCADGVPKDINVPTK